MVNIGGESGKSNKDKRIISKDFIRKFIWNFYKKVIRIQIILINLIIPIHFIISTIINLLFALQYF